MPDPDIIFSSVDGPYGQVKQELNNATLHLRYLDSPLGVHGEYRRKGEQTWHTIPEGGTGVDVLPGNVVEIRSSMGGLVAQNCVKVAPESPSRATFQFNWSEPNAPSVTIEVEEMGITDS